MLPRSNARHALARPLRAHTSGAQVPSTYRSLWSSDRGILPWQCTFRRFYRAGEDGRKSGTILTRNGTAVTEEDVISAITPVRLWSNSLNNERDVVVLVSKGLSHWLNAGNDFLSDLLRKLLKHHIASHISQINLILAVVDRIPAPSTSTGDGETLKAVSPVQDIGSEGLAYQVEDGQQLLQPDDVTAIPAHNSIRDRNRPFEGPPGAIQFRFVDPQQNAVPTSLDVALANTIFSTATRRILRRSTWTLPLRQSHSRDLETAAVKLLSGKISKLTPPSPDRRYRVPDLALGLDIPLTPLTPRRIISDCMGNVIRGIKDAKAGASKELEDAVTQYFEDKGESPTTAAVWAVIVPQHLLDSIYSPMKRVDVSGEDNHKNSFEQTPVMAIWRGATLRKVISGGGGWGDKAGLLSLDHDTGVSPSSSRSNNNNMELDLDVPDFADLFSQKRLIDDIAKPGDSIQFFIAPENKDVSRSTAMDDNVRELPRLTTLDFGVIPIATEAVEANPSTSVRDEGGKMTEVFPGHFGALSEVGLGLRRQISGFHNTKIDVPFSRFWYQQFEQRKRKNSEPNDVPGAPKKAHNGGVQYNVRRPITAGTTHRVPQRPATTFVSAFQGRSLNDVLGKQAPENPGTPGNPGQSRQYSTRAPQNPATRPSRNIFHLSDGSHQEEGEVPASRIRTQTRTRTRAKMASEQAGLDSEDRLENSADAGFRVQRTSSRSALDHKGAFRLAKSDPTSTPAVRHVLAREGHETQPEDSTISAYHDESRAISQDGQDAKLQQGNAAAYPRKYDLGFKVRKHGVRESIVRRASASRPTPLAEVDSSQSAKRVQTAYGPSLTKHEVSRTFKKYKLEGPDSSNVTTLRRKRKHAFSPEEIGGSQVNGVTSLATATSASSIDNTGKPITHPPEINSFRTYVTPDAFSISRDRRIKTRSTFEALQNTGDGIKAQPAPLQQEGPAPLRQRRQDHVHVRSRRIQSGRSMSMRQQAYSKMRRQSRVRKHVVDKSDLFAEYDVRVRKTVPKKMPRYPSALLRIPVLMQRRARARRKSQSGSIRMVRKMPSTRLVRAVPSSRSTRSRRVRRAYTLRRQRAHSVHKMAARGTAEDKRKLQEIKAWLDARMAASSTTLGGDYAFKIEDWSASDHVAGNGMAFKPRSNRALDEIDDVFRDLYGQ